MAESAGWRKKKKGKRKNKEVIKERKEEMSWNNDNENDIKELNR